MLNNFTRPAEGLPSIVCDLRRVNETKAEFEYNLKPLTYYGGKPSLWFYTARDTVPVPKTVGNLFLDDISLFSPKFVKEIAEIAKTTVEKVWETRLDDLPDDSVLSLVSTPICPHYYEVISDSKMDERVLFKLLEKPSFDELYSLFFDRPILCRLDVDGQTFCLDEKLSDVYVYNKSELIDAYSGREAEYVKKWLSDNLPDELNYEY